MSSVDGVNNSDSNQDDFWGQSRDAFAHTNRPANILRKKSEPVKDDWDDEEEDEVDEETIWREANTKAPMPEVIIARPSTTSVVPPPEAFQAPVRILKRPKAASGASQPTNNAALLQKTLEDREAAYQAARERIFGSSKPGSSPGTPAEEKSEDLSASFSKLEVASQSQRQRQDKEKGRAGSRSMSAESIGRTPPFEQSGVSVIRNPRGPSTSGTPGSSTPRGFGGRRGGKRGLGSKENDQNQPPSAQIPVSSGPSSSS